jgi:parallel beta-helix repeat protein
MSLDMVEKVSAGTTLYVNTTGDGGAYTSIQDAINASSDGDTVFVYEGTYNERITINKKITLMGMDQEDTTIDGGWYGNVVNITVDWVNISGFYILGGYFGDNSIALFGIQNCSISNITIYGNQGSCIYSENSYKITIKNNTLRDTEFGIYITNSSDNLIMNNYLIDNKYGIFLQNSNSINITENNASHSNQYGFYLNHSHNNSIKHNEIRINSYGIWLNSSHDNHIIDNNATDNWDNIHLYKSNNNDIKSNYLHSVGYGMQLDSSLSNNIIENAMFESSIYIYGDKIEFWTTHIIDTSNTVNGKPLYYLKNQNGASVPLGAGQVILANCTNIPIENQELSSGSVGIELGFSLNITIANNNITNNNLFGIYFYNSSGNNIFGNNLSSRWWSSLYLLNSSQNNITNNIISNNEIGIYLYSSGENNITGNNISSNDGYGIYLFNSSNRNIISYNIITANDHGIYLDTSNDNLVIRNNASSNERCGIHLYSSNENSIFGNNASFNRYGIYVENSKSNNIKNTTMIKNGIFLLGDLLEHWNTHSINISNEVNAKPLYYWKNQTDGIIPLHAGQVILANCTSIEIEHQELENSSVGIEVGFSSNINISNNNASGNWNGIYLWNYNTATDNNYGIRLYSSNFTNFINNTVSYQKYGGVSIGYSMGNNIKNNTASYNGDSGIALGNLIYSNISGNLVSNNEDYGLSIQRSDGNNITENTASYNKYGMRIYSSNWNNITNNNVSKGNTRGIFLSWAFWNNISNNLVKSNYYGIFLERSDYNKISVNTILSSQSNIRFSNSNWNVISNNLVYFGYNSIDIGGIGNNITNNTVSGATWWTDGIVISSTWGNITGNNVSNCFNGIVLRGGSNNIFRDNNVTKNEYGIRLQGSSDSGNKVYNNNISYNLYYGIYLSSASEKNITGNNLIGNGIGVYGNWLHHWNTHYIDTSNTVNGKPVIYWKNQTGGTIPAGAAQVILANCSNIRIEGHELTNASRGIQLGFSSNNTIIDNNVSANQDSGIYVYQSNDNNITNNTVNSNYKYGIFNHISHRNNIIGNNVSFTKYKKSSSWYGEGIHLTSSNWNNIESNILISNRYEGIYLYSSHNNNITKNNIVNSSRGIRLKSSNSNILKSNNVTLNSYGFYFEHSRYNNIYKNNIINSSYKQAFDNRYENSWDNGYAYGGNFWSDYSGYDNFSGANQDIPGSDGIGDTNYTIDSDSIDNYPLMEPFPGIFPPRIELVQGNNSVISPGVILDFIVNAMDLDFVNYSLNGGQEVYFPSPYDINTSGWAEGVHEIFIRAYDKNNMSTLSTFFVTVDTIKSSIILNDPINNSVIYNETFLNFSIIEPNIMHVNYSINEGYNISLPNPYNISTAGWIDGYYKIQINAIDLAGNSNSSWYYFIIDCKPTVLLNNPQNNSIIKSGIILDFSIIDINLTEANYSINEGANISFAEPFNISTTGWEDENYTIQVNALDSLGNSNSSWFFFIIDSTKPIIKLNAPDNDSFIPSGTILDFSIIDPHIWYVTYKINGVGNYGFYDPYNLSTSGWSEGYYKITIYAYDLAGNSNSTWYSFTIDDEPVILLNNPENNSVIRNGTILDFSIRDTSLLNANYSINGGAKISFLDPFNILTTGWTDGTYTVKVNALDTVGNSHSEWFNFTIDTTNPIIILNSPENKSYIQSGTILDFSIIELHLIHANYSINSGPNITFSKPFNISTFGWADGNYTIQINAIDQVGISNSSWFVLTIDTIKPIIQLNSPLNNSIIPSGTILDLLIEDLSLNTVNYSINGGADIFLSEPFNISTTGWSDGEYIVQINALDKAGNLNSSLFSFTFDSSPPEILLYYPGNNSVIKNGTLLNFDVIDQHLYQVNYSINGGADLIFTPLYDISTSGWIDGEHTIQIIALDDLGNMNISWFFFIIDSTKSVILFNSPGNNSVFHNGTPLDFSIIDANLLQVNYSINGGPHISLSDPFDISTSGWDDGDYTIEINSEDMAGNINSSWFFITVDSTVPLILLISPGNNSVIPSGTILDFYITDNNLLETNYSINGGAEITFSEPYNVSTSGWGDGDYLIQVNALDMDGNSRTSSYFFKIDSTKPQINLNSPENLSYIPNGIILNFSITDVNLMHVNYSINGESNISFSDPFDISTTGWSDGDYIIQMNSKDMAENTHSLWFIFTVDSTLPIVSLNSPENNSIIQSGIILDFSVMDLNLNQVTYSINGGSNLPLSHPFNISTIGWVDGNYKIQINITDLAENSNSFWYFFTFDSTKPIIEIISPLNNSYILPGTILDFSVSDLNLHEVNYSINDGSILSFYDPYNISTIGWADGIYKIQINTLDLAGNFKSSYFIITIDSKMPNISLNSPLNNSFIIRGFTLDFTIKEINIKYTNYSVNGGPFLPFSDPFNISTSGWFDGEYLIWIEVLDLAGNFNSTFFSFTIDTKKPTINLNSPQNNTFISQGIILDFTIIDTILMHVNYSINEEPANPISSPFNISTLGWPDGNYTIQINAKDMAGNSGSTWFFFFMDSKIPKIVINDPMQNSIIKSGTILDFTVEDQNLTLVNYSINGGANILLNEPYDISTNGWPDGGYTIIMRALDTAGNLNTSGFFFTLDSTKPDIFLVYPENNSLISNKTIIEFLVTDSNLKHVNYSINSGQNVSASDMFNISAKEWTDGNYTVQINAMDLAGNYRSNWFWFVIDSTPPTIVFDQFLNHSTISGGIAIQIDISDENINTVMYSVNQGAYNILLPPYIIDTTSWSDGPHVIYIKANDSAGNEIVRWFEIIVDSIPPFVVTSIPQDQSESIEINTSIIITFSEPMNQADVGNYLTFSASIDYTYIWEEDGTILNISFEPNKLAEGTKYTLEVDKQIKDIIGNPMISDFELEFTTKTSTPIPTPKSEEPESPYWIFAIVAIIAVVLILLFFLLTRRRGKEEEPQVESEEGKPIILEGMAEVVAGEEPREGISWIQEKEAGPPEATPPVIAPIKPQPQVKCPRCNGMFNIDTSVVPYMMNCPNCGLRGKVERK